MNLLAKMSFHRIAILGLVFAFCIPAQAQSNHDYQTWAAFLSSGKIGRDLPLRSWLDVHARRGDAGTVLIVRPGIGYQPLPWLSIWAGYAWVPVFDDTNESRRDEHRAWQQVILSFKLLKKTLGLQSRTRFEQRFVESFDVGLRVRQFLRADYRFGSDSKWALALWDELFVGVNEPGFAPLGFDQNRVFLGPALYAHPRIRVEAGYLWTVLQRNATIQHQHVLALNFFVRTDLP